MCEKIIDVNHRTAKFKLSFAERKCVSVRGTKMKMKSLERINGAGMFC